MRRHSGLFGSVLESADDRYLRQVLGRYPPGAGAKMINLLRLWIDPIVRGWAGPYLNGIEVSGSNAKRTAVGGQTDLDLFISIRHDVPRSLSQIYWSLFQTAGQSGWAPRPRNVSVGIEILGYKVDLVPARVQQGYLNRHSLYRRKAESWTQTDVTKHINLVRDSNRLEEIRLTKIWRMLHGLEFPSFALELAVLQATRGRHTGALAENFREVLRYLGGDFPAARLVDPSNTANVVSEDLTKPERTAIMVAARRACVEPNWARVVW